MKKIFTLFAMGLMAAPVINAVDKDITISLIEMTETFDGTEIVKNNEKVAELGAKLSYDNTTKQYIIPSFLGYNDAEGNPVTLQFSIGTEPIVQDGETRYLLFVYEPNVDPEKPVAENSGLTYSWIPREFNGTYFYNSFYLPLEENPNKAPSGETTTDYAPHMSSIFTGEDYDYKLYTPFYWMCIEQKPVNTVVQRSYATLGTDGTYNIVIEGSCGCYYRKLHDSDAWPTTIYENPETGSRELKHQLNFSLNPADFVGGSTAIEDIDTDSANAPVEYYNLQGVRVENPANGIYICRQGNKVTKKVIM